MSLSREAMLELMALADGELDGEGRARTYALMAVNEEARQLVESLRSPVLGSVLADIVAERMAPADGIADAVMARLNGIAVGDVGAAAMSDGRAAAVGDIVAVSDVRAADAAVVHLGAARGAGARQSRVALALGSGLATLALAAGVLVWVQSRHRLDAPTPVASVVAPSPSVGPPMKQSATALAQEGTTPPGVEVDEIDSPHHDVHVFEIPATAPPSIGAAAAAAASVNASSVVIMIEDEPSHSP